ncbi:MAG: family 43 glycosylhydrolase [Dysgonamonadaceae bacterium]|jgi:hypothetical protein|nr:family 43 glycosylhydrolase [Dysgonamonadaceae bacterium]
MKKGIIVLLLLVYWPGSAQTIRKYDSYKGLAMAGYQGWFSCPGDGSDRGWYHYCGKDDKFHPGNCTIDMWPDVSEYEKIYKTDFVFADGRPAYVMSEYDESTVQTHFRWMREYGIDGVFVQRFVAEIKRPKSYNQLNKVWKSAIHAANTNHRAIGIMYDLSGMLPGDEQLVLMDIDSIAKQYDIRERIYNPSYLHHNGKPLVAVWGVGFNDRRKYGFREAEIIIDALIERGYSVLIGVPTHWRKLEDDTLNDPELHRLIRKCDIVMPWFVGRYNEQTFPRYEKLVKEDMEWCKQNNVDYAPLAFPGFSWVNMNKGSKPIPRNRGSFYWQQLTSHIHQGAEMLYLAMFDEIDEGTAIFKCATEVPVGKSYFLPLDADLGNDYYLVLAGKASRMLKKTQSDNNRIIANPMDLNYRFQFDEPSRREAADPVCEYFNGKYYLFASKSGGYWSSQDLVNWNYIRCTTIPVQENYAPTILVWEGKLYYFVSGSTRIFYTDNPDIDQWKELTPSRFEYSVTDPAFFKDDSTGKVYMYWGCSDKDPIMGVEINPANNFQAVGTPLVLIEHNVDKYGWEVPGNNNEENRTGWNEGPCMIQYKGKYYLQYAAPGTQYRIYGDGIYVGNHPLGPFTYMENSPFSFKPGGFIGGAGHGHTFQDKYGNYWHVATMRISQRHSFERRLGLFPVYFDENDHLCAHTVWTDYPFVVPDEKTDLKTNDGSLHWNLLSYKQPVTASSVYAEYIPENANNEAIENGWSAQTGNAGEWWQIDLGKTMKINAIQVNFADQDVTVKAPDSYVVYQYYIKTSNDGKNWVWFSDRTHNTVDRPHELLVADTAQTARYIRITNAKNRNGKFSLSGFRVFGKGNGEIPPEVTGIQIHRNENDPRRFTLTWNKQENTTGYVVRWGVNENQLTHASMVFSNRLEAGYFNRDSEYYFSIDAWNENGVTAGKQIYHNK